MKMLSPTLNEAIMKGHMADDDDAILKSLHDAVRLAREMAHKTSEMTSIVLANGLKTQAARHKDARAAGFALLERSTQDLDEALKGAKAEITAIQTKIQALVRKTL
jgi:hypothetical protein